MLRRIAAAMMLACATITVPPGAARADAQAAVPFEVVPRMQGEHRSHFGAYAVALAGAGLVAASFPLADTADRRYAQYLAEVDPTAISGRWDATVRADHVASGTLLAGEALLATSVYLRFLRHPSATTGSRVSVRVTPSRCALALRF